MATSFPARPYASNLARGAGQPAYQSTPYNAQTPYNASLQQAQHPNPTGGAFGAAGASSGLTQQQREAQRLERERHDRAERERREAGDRDVLERLSDEHKEEINEAFSLFDLDKDEYIDYHELKVALKALGFDLPKPDLLDILTTHGIPATNIHPQQQPQSQPPGAKQQQQQPSQAPQAPVFAGPHRLLLSHSTFTLIAAQRVLARDPRDEILRAFDLFDAEGKGLISVDDLRRVARELGEGLSDEEMIAMVEEFDVRGEGGIGREEFVGICLGG